MTLTPTRQRNAVSEGVALGLVLCGRDSLPFDKVATDLAFAGAWRNWDRRGMFPQVNTDISKGLDGTRAMTRAAGGTQTAVLFWDTSGGELTIYARQSDWNSNDEADLDFALETIDGGIPLQGWVSLARGFLTRLER